MVGLRLLFVVFAIVGAPGCGNEGDEPSGRFAPGTSLPFVVVSTQPAASQQDVPRNAAVVVRFSDFPDPATLSYPWISIGPRSDPATFSTEVSLVDREVRFLPSRPLLAKTEVVVAISRRVHSLAGVALGTTFRMVFRTGDGLQPDPTPPSAPRLIDLAGRGGLFELSCAQARCHRRDDSGHAAASLDFAQDAPALREHLLSDRRGGLDALRWVEVGRPETSYLLRKLLAAQPDAFVRTTGSPMPLARPALSLDALRTIETWIRSGAN